MGLIKTILVLCVVVGAFSVNAKVVVRDEQAQKLYDQLAKLQSASPDQVTSYTNAYFGDATRPRLGKLWVTTIYLSVEPNYFCYEYDFRESNVKDYVCDVY